MAIHKNNKSAKGKKYPNKLAVTGKSKTKSTPRRATTKTKKGGVKTKQVQTPRKTTYRTKITKRALKKLSK